MRQSRTSGGEGRPWLDTRADLARRCAAWQTTLQRAGVKSQDRVLITLPLTWPIGSDAYLALLDLGALTMVTQRAAPSDIAQFSPTVLVTKPGEALRLAQPGDDLGQVHLVVVTGEPGGSLDVTRHAIEDRWGADCLDVYALSELGTVGWGCAARSDGIHLDDQQFQFEVIDPDNETPTSEGELGELLITTPSNWDTPLENFRTGDLVRLTTRGCECGRQGAWAKGGILGRVAERLSIRGQAILPSSIEQVIRRHPAVVDFRLRTYFRGTDSEVAIELETTEQIASEGDRARVAAEVGEDLRRSLGVRLPCDVIPARSEARGRAGK